MDSTKNISLFICECMDNLGFNESVILYRRKIFEKIDSGYSDSLKGIGFRAITTGSAAEGLAIPFQNQYDLSIVKVDVKCYHIAEQLGPTPSDVLVLKSKQDDSPPGYTLLILDYNPLKALFYQNDVCRSIFGDHLYSLYYHALMKGRFTREDSSVETQGPALVPFMKAEIGKYNYSFPLSYEDAKLFDKFRSRERCNEWPTKEAIGEICRTQIFVVPCSSPGSDKGYLEWRICYTAAELYLFKTLNETQLKLYLLLKMLVKSELQPISKDITSYTVKNLVFWMAEIYPSHRFKDENMLLLLLTGLGMLYNAVRSGKFQSYISEQNLLPGTLDAYTKHDLLQTMAQLTQEKARMFIRLKMLRNIMFKMFSARDVVEKYGSLRNKLEMRLLLLNLIQKRYIKVAKTAKEFVRCIVNDDDWVTVAKSIYDMVDPEWAGGHVADEKVKFVTLNRIKEIFIHEDTTT